MNCLIFLCNLTKSEKTSVRRCSAIIRTSVRPSQTGTNVRQNPPKKQTNVLFPAPVLSGCPFSPVPCFKNDRLCNKMVNFGKNPVRSDRAQKRNTRHSVTRRGKRTAPCELQITPSCYRIYIKLNTLRGINI